MSFNKYATKLQGSVQRLGAKTLAEWVLLKTIVGASRLKLSTGLASISFFESEQLMKKRADASTK